LFLRTDSSNPLRQSFENRQCFCIYRSSEISRSVLVDHCRKRGVTVTAALAAALSFAIGKKFPKSPELLSTCWVALGGHQEWGNGSLGVAFLRLANDPKLDEMGMLNRVSERLKSIKASVEAIVSNRLLKLLGWLDIPNVTRFFTDKASVSISSVAGPVDLVNWPGKNHQVKQLHVLVPPVQSMGLMAVLISYGDTVTLSLTGSESLFTSHTLNELHGLSLRYLSSLNKTVYYLFS
jgi:hypothetical protein